MDTVLTVINQNVDLNSEKILVYLKPQGNNTNWESSVWQACSPQSEGGSYKLDAITNNVGAYISFDGDKSRSAYKLIKVQSMATVVQNGNELDLEECKADNLNLTKCQYGIKNMTTRNDIYPVWCLNEESICRPINPMYNNGFSSFQLSQKAYFTIGSVDETRNFKVQNWEALTEIDLPNNLAKADIVVSLDEVTHKVNFEIKNSVFE